MIEICLENCKSTTGRQCRVFDKRLQEFPTERSVALNAFATLDELQEHLNGR